MADVDFLNARVIYKVATEAEWNAITLDPLIKGEIYFYNFPGDANKIINLKIGDGVRQPRDLPYFFDAAFRVPFFGSASPTDTPDPATGDGFWIVTEEGEYTNFGGVELPANSLGVITRVGTSYSIVVSSIDLSGYVSSDMINAPNGVLGLDENGEAVGYAKQIETDNINIKLGSITTEEGDSILGDLQNGYIQRSNGAFVSSANWRSTGFIDVSQGYVFKYKGRNNSSPTPSSSCVIGYNTSNVLVEVLLDVITDDTVYNTVVISNPSITRIRACALMADPETNVFELVEAATLVPQNKVKDLPKELAKIGQIADFVNTNISQNPEVGYVNGSNVVVDQAAWRYIKDYDVRSSSAISYEGFRTINAPALIGIKENGEIVTLIPGSGSSSAPKYTEVVNRPDDVVRISGSARMSQEGDVFNIIVSEVILKGKVQNEDDGTDPATFFVPKEFYVPSGQNRRMYLDAMIVGARDAFFGQQNASEDFLLINTTANMNATLKYTSGASKSIKTAGVTNVKVFNSSSITPPSNPLYFMWLGASTFYGVNSADSSTLNPEQFVQGILPTEVIRLLTGNNDYFGIGDIQPNGYGISNINVIGTLGGGTSGGKQLVMHEGRSGWAASDYLTLAARNGVTNAFWNPSTNQFDLSYYLTQNGFSQITSNGSNLVIPIWMVWNEAYNGTGVPASIENTQALVDRIHATHPQAKVILMGGNPVPSPMIKSFSGSRNVSREAICEEVLFPISEGYQNIADTTTNTYFFAVHPFMTWRNSYGQKQTGWSNRTNDNYIYYTDHVHPNRNGYAQVASGLADFIVGKILLGL